MQEKKDDLAERFLCIYKKNMILFAKKLIPIMHFLADKAYSMPNFLDFDEVQISLKFAQ